MIHKQSTSITLNITKSILPAKKLNEVVLPYVVDFIDTTPKLLYSSSKSADKN